MQVTVTIGKYKADLAKPLDISIPVSFGKKQLSAFGGGPAVKNAYAAGGFIGDVRQGGSCNCEVYQFSPHLNGTHTECIGHLTQKRTFVHKVLQESLLPATLVSVKPGKSSIITRAMLEKSLKKPDDFLEALVIRTLPNGKEKITRNYKTAAYFSPDAMHYIVRRGVRHLLVDFPSVDRLDDPDLINHRIFWDKKNSAKTITEFVYVPAAIKDGRYLLNLQVSSFEGDAAPSRPLLYRVKA